MLKKKLLLSFAVFSSFLPLTALAGGNSTYGTATRAETMQAFTAVADDASAVFYNPAGLTQLKGSHIEAGGGLIIPNLAYDNTLNNTTSHSHRNVINQNTFFATDYIKPLHLGMGMYAPNARDSRYAVNPAVYNTETYLKLVRLDFVPTVAIDLNSIFSVGASVVVSRVSVAQAGFGLRQQGMGYGYTGQAGLLARLPKNIKVGLDFRGPLTVNVSGRGFLNGGVVSETASGDVRFPPIVTAGLAWQAMSSLLFSASYEYEMWSYVKRVTIHYQNPTMAAIGSLPIYGKNVGNIRLGTLYRGDSSPHEFRAGYSYLPSAVPTAYNVPTSLDFNTHVFAAGYSYYYKKQWRFDAGYEYATGLTTHSTNAYYPGSYKVSVNTLLLGLGYTFA